MSDNRSESESEPLGPVFWFMLTAAFYLPLLYVVARQNNHLAARVSALEQAHPKPKEGK